MARSCYVGISRLILLGLLVCGLGVEPAIVTAAQAETREPSFVRRIDVSDCNIQTAIQNCVGSCTIFVAAGTCPLAATLNWAGTGKQINLECAGRQDTILTWPVGVIGITPDSFARIAHCDLRGPNVSSAGDELIESYGTTDVVIEDDIIEEAGEHGINTGGGSLRWTIRNNLIRNNKADGIFLASGTSDSVVADNIIMGNASNGIDCNCSGTAIHGNISKSNGLPGGAIDRDGILVSGIFGGQSANYNSVVGNETSFNGGSGITIRADLGTTANFNTVSGNVSHDNGGTSNNGDGIQVDGSDLGNWAGNTIVGNTVYNNQRFGIEVDGQNAVLVETTLISSNTSIGNGNTGIMVGAANVADTSVVNNIVVNNAQAQIQDLGSLRPLIAGNKQDMTDSSFVVQGNLVANSITSQGASPLVIPNSQYIEAQNSGSQSQEVLLGLDNSNQTILRGGGGPNSILIQTSSGAEGASMTDAGAWTFPGGLTIGTGISRNGSGLKHQSVQTGSIPPASSALVTLTWTTAFADGNYDPECNVLEPTSTPATIRIHHIQSLSANSINVVIVNDDPQQSHVGTLYCLGIHQ